MLEYNLKSAFDPFFNAPIEVWKGFVDLCEVVAFQKNEVIKSAGKVEKNAYFIISGACGVFLWKENNFVCLDIVLENDFFADHMSLITGENSDLQTMSLEKTSALRISKTKIELLKKTPFGSVLFLIGAEHSFVQKQKQQIDLLTKTAEARYEELMLKNPKLIQRIAQKHIASYLGIATPSLSRIRKKI
jgi:CRP-like cAMP-binding protein